MNKILMSLCFVAIPFFTFASETPRDARGTQIGVSSVKWEWQALAYGTQYDLFVDGVFKTSTVDNFFVSENLWAGDHSFQVQALSPQGRYSQKSATQKMVVRGDWRPGMLVKSYTVGQESPPVVSNPVVSAPPPPGQNQEAPGNSESSSMVDPSTWLKDGAGKEGYRLVFSDEFDSKSALDSNKWNTQLRWDGDWNGARYEYRVINGENQMYVNTLAEDVEHQKKLATLYSPFELDGQVLKIRAVKNPERWYNTNLSHGPLESIFRQQEFLSGVITTHDKFHTKYGYFEARIRIPNHVGTFPAFWLHHQNRLPTQKSEIDIMENLGHAPQYVYNSFHTYTGVTEYDSGHGSMLTPTQPGQSRPNGQIYRANGFAKGYHTYAVAWEPGTIRWYIDDVLVNTLYDGRVDFEELYIIINLAMGGNWTNFPTTSGGLGRDYADFFPNWSDLQSFQNPSLNIDYVRVYKRE